jgi:hypothetical protein
MGPPRAPPPHKFLHGLCTEAERFTADRHHEIHKEMMAEINETIAKHTERYIKIEDAVRSELEILYNTFIDTNVEAREPSTSKRRGSVLGKAKSRSASREPVQRKFSPPPKGHPSIQSVISGPQPPLKLKISWNEDLSDLPEARDDAKTVPPPIAGSLLTQSLATSRQQAPAPPIEAPLGGPEQDLEQIRRGAKTKEQIEIGMSYAFSALDERMANAPAKDKPDAIQRAQVDGSPRQSLGKKRMEETPGRSLPSAIPENQEESSSEEGGSPQGSVVEEPEEEIVFENQETSSSEGSGSPHKPDASDHGESLKTCLYCADRQKKSLNLKWKPKKPGHPWRHPSLWRKRTNSQGMRLRTETHGRIWETVKFAGTRTRIFTIPELEIVTRATTMMNLKNSRI